MDNHAHTWVVDKARKHGRPGRFFVICECGETAQCSENGAVFKTAKPQDLVGCYFKITREQAAWLKKQINQSETVRFALADVMRRGIYSAV